MARIMIADDNLEICRSFQVIINLSGHQIVAVAHDGLDALRDYFEYKPDVALLDNQMPGMHGIDVAARILERDITAKIILCSTVPEEIEHYSRSLGITIIPKYSFDHINEAIHQALQ